jgi:hypothetical protein
MEALYYTLFCQVKKKNEPLSVTEDRTLAPYDFPYQK